MSFSDDLRDIVKEIAMDNYDIMPTSVKRKMVSEGKKQIERDHPIASLFMTESTKKNLVEGYFAKRSSKKTGWF